jgi:hypothetical protein
MLGRPALDLVLAARTIEATTATRQRYRHGWIPIIDDPFGGRDPATMTDDDLLDTFATISRTAHPDEAALHRIDAELARREPGLPDTAEQRRVDELVAKGWDYRDAYAEAHNLNPDDLRRQELAAAVDAQKARGETRDQVARRLYAETVHLSYLRAEQWTRGHLLSPAGRAAGVDPITLFSGPRARARRHASEELKRFWEEVEPRQMFVEFRAAILGRDTDRRAAKLAQQQGHERDFGL